MDVTVHVVQSFKRALRLFYRNLNLGSKCPVCRLDQLPAVLTGFSIFVIVFDHFHIKVRPSNYGFVYCWHSCIDCASDIRVSRLMQRLLHLNQGRMFFVQNSQLFFQFLYFFWPFKWLLFVCADNLRVYSVVNERFGQIWWYINRIEMRHLEHGVFWKSLASVVVFVWTRFEPAVELFSHKLHCAARTFHIVFIKSWVFGGCVD